MCVEEGTVSESGGVGIKSYMKQSLAAAAVTMCSTHPGSCFKAAEAHCLCNGCSCKSTVARVQLAPQTGTPLAQP